MDTPGGMFVGVPSSSEDNAARGGLNYNSAPNLLPPPPRRKVQHFSQVWSLQHFSQGGSLQHFPQVGSLKMHLCSSYESAYRDLTVRVDVALRYCTINVNKPPRYGAAASLPACKEQKGFRQKMGFSLCVCVGKVNTH